MFNQSLSHVTGRLSEANGLLGLVAQCMESTLAHLVDHTHFQVSG